jgi:hypothetical protein
MSDDLKRYNKVPIDLYHRDQLVKDYAPWYLGVWEYTEGHKIWGLVHGNSETHMCYRVEDNPLIRIAESRERYTTDPNPDWLRWYFDVGARIYMTIDDLEKACKELGIWDVHPAEEDSTPSVK